MLKDEGVVSFLTVESDVPGMARVAESNSLSVVSAATGLGDLIVAGCADRHLAVVVRVTHLIDDLTLRRCGRLRGGSSRLAGRLR